jgi:hypothetical protein
MIRRAAWWLLAATLAPSAWLAWQWRDLQHLGIYHDDSVYWVGAKSLAAGEGYRIESLPGAPHQTKYPPLYPALLSVAWRLRPEFPGNLPLAMLLNWLALPPLIAASWRLYRDWGFSTRLACVFCAAIALNPTVVNMSVMLMTENLFLALLVTAMILAERARRLEAGVRLAAVAGLLGGLCFLTRSSALPLLVSAPAVFAWRRQWRKAAGFAAAMLPAVAGWMLWSRAHRPTSPDLTLMYYTDYLGFHLANVSLAEMPNLMWLNAGALAFGLSELLLFSDAITFWSQQLARLVAIAGVAGVVRMSRARGLAHYPAFALLFVVQATMWHYPPHNRFVLPVLPLLIAGFCTEMAHLAGIVRASWRKPKAADRAAAVAIGALAAGVVALAAWRMVWGVGVFLPGVLSQHRAIFEGNREAYRWIVENTPREAPVFAYSDPLMYLYTGRRGLSARIPPRLLYKAEPGAIGRYVETLPEIAQRHRLDYVLFTAADFQFDSPEVGLAALRRVLEESGDFRPVYQSARASIFRVEPGGGSVGATEPTAKPARDRRGPPSAPPQARSAPREDPAAAAVAR